MKKIQSLVAIMLCMCMIFLLTACSSQKTTQTGPDGKVVVDFWNPFTGPDGKYMQKMVEEFNEKNKGKIEVKVQIFPGAEYYDKLRTAVQSGQGPDVIIMHADQIPSMVRGKVVKDIGKLVDELGFKGEDYIQSGWQAGEYKSKRYGIALDVHPLVLYYNKDLVKKYDLKVPTTYAELIENGKKATQDGNYGFAMATVWPAHLIFRTAMLQNGSELVSVDGTKSLVNSEVGLKAFDLINDLSVKYQIAPEKLPRDGHINLFKQGKVAFMVDGIWMGQGFKEAGLNYGIAPMQTLFGATPAVWASSHQFAVTNKKDTNKEKAIATFIKYISDNSLDWAKAGQVVANKKVLASDEFKKLDDQVNAQKEIEYTKLAPQLDTWIDMWHPVVENNLSAALTGEKSPKDALDAAAKEGTEKAKATLESMK
jgi:multiple sugar transport system substrate-binding protein